MKKLFAVVLSVVLMIGMALSVFAADTYTNCEHYGQTVTASESGYVNILFSDGYRGFCICKGWDDADRGDAFTVDNMGLAINHNSEENISGYLKAMFVDCFNDIFTVDATNLTYTMKSSTQVQRVVWYFSNSFSSSDHPEDAVLANKVKAAAQSRTEAIPDHGYTVKVNDTTLATFDFHVLKSGGWVQNFWTYKVTLTPYPAPVITTPTTDQTVDVAEGSSTQFSVTATDAEGYQWQVDTGDGTFVNISGATTATYTTPAVTAENKDYKYRCVATNTAGSDTSPVFSVNMIEAPKFTSPTEDTQKDVYTGETATLEVTATNSPKYQWQVDKGDGNGFQNMEGATADSYTTPVISEENAGYKYRCVASNLAGSDTSYVFSVNWIKAPVFTKPEANQVVELDEGQSTTLTAAATDAQSYQWQLDTGDGFKDIDGATGATYTVGAAAEENTGYKYRCVASNPSGSATSFVFTLKVNNIDPPVITEGSEDDEIDAEQGEEVALSVEAEDGETYQWQVDTGDGFKDIEGAVEPEYTVDTGAAGEVKYRCVVSNENGDTVSGVFTVKVHATSSNTNTGTNTNTNTNTKTGDPAAIGLCAAMLLLSLAALAVIRKRFA